MTTILSLPNEVMAAILSNLDLRDLIRSGRVCRKWKELCGETNTVEGVATKDLYVLSMLLPSKRWVVWLKFEEKLH